MKAHKPTKHLQRPAPGMIEVRRPFKIIPCWAPWDFRIGVSWVNPMKTLYIVPFPCIGFAIQFPKTERIPGVNISWTPKRD